MLIIGTKREREREREREKEREKINIFIMYMHYVYKYLSTLSRWSFYDTWEMDIAMWTLKMSGV